MLKNRAGGRLLELVELAGKLKLKCLTIHTFIVQVELDTELPNQRNDVRQAATRKSQVAIKIFKASDDAGRAGD